MMNRNGGAGRLKHSVIQQRHEADPLLHASERKIQKLEEEQLGIQRQIEELATLVKVYDEHLRLSDYGKCGSSSEKNKDKNKYKENVEQLLLFDEADLN